jgi:hypothetical protein
VTDPAPAPEPPSEWEPGYVTWGASVYAGAFAGSAAASWLAPVLAAATRGWGLPALHGLLIREGAGGPALYLSLAMMMVLISVLPGLLSLFLVTLTQLRLALHPLVGTAFFAVSAGWVSQSAAGAVFGFVFGFASLGTIALLLGLRRRLDLRRRVSGRV